MRVRGTRRAGAALRILALGCAIGLLGACTDPQEKLAEHLRRGEVHLAEGRPREAIVEFRAALQIAPNRAETRFALAKAHAALGDMRAALWQLQESLRIDPGNLEVKTRYAEALRLSGEKDDVELAAILADEVLALEPSRVEAWVVKGAALQSLERFDEARAALESAVSAAPENAVATLRLAQLLHVLEQDEEAERLFRRATELAPGFESQASLALFLAARPGRDVEAEAAYRKALELAEEGQRVRARMLLADFFFARRRFDASEQILREGIEAEQGSTRLGYVYALARLRDALGQQAGAEAAFEEATRIDPADPDPYLALSTYRERRGDAAGALAAAEALLGAAPSDVRGQLRKAELLVSLSEGRPESLQEARQLVGGVLEGEPSQPEALVVQGKLELAAGDAEAAVSTLRRAVETRPDWAVAHLVLGSALFLKGEAEASRGELVRALELEPQLLEAQRGLLRVHARLRDDERVVEVGGRLLERQPGDAETGLLVAQSLVRLERLDEALGRLEAIPLEQRNAAVHYALGRARLLKGDRVAAREHFERADALDPNRYEFLRALVELDVREERASAASERIAGALRAEPDDARFVRLSGQLALSLGRLDEARRSFERAIELDPNDLSAYQQLVRVLLLSGAGEAVLETYEKALAANPDSGSLHTIVGSLYEQAGRPQEAIARYESALRLDPSLAVAKNDLAYLILETGGDLDRALALAREAKEGLPDSAEAADTLGWILHAKGLSKAALAYLQEAERVLDPGDPRLGIVRSHLAAAYEGAGEPASALEVVERALRDVPAAAGGESEPEWVRRLREQRQRLGARPAESAPG